VPSLRALPAGHGGLTVLPRTSTITLRQGHSWKRMREGQLPKRQPDRHKSHGHNITACKRLAASEMEHVLASPIRAFHGKAFKGLQFFAMHTSLLPPILQCAGPAGRKAMRSTPGSTSNVMCNLAAGYGQHLLRRDRWMPHDCIQGVYAAEVAVLSFMVRVGQVPWRCRPRVSVGRGLGL
jgi:hypothetical protein